MVGRTRKNKKGFRAVGFKKENIFVCMLLVCKRAEISSMLFPASFAAGEVVFFLQED